MNMFLRAKHWQIFLLTFGLPFLLQMAFVTSILSGIRHNNPDGMIDLYWINLIPLAVVLFAGILFGWIWAVAMGLQSKVPAHVKMKTGKFKAFFFIPATYILLLCVFLIVLFSGLVSGANQPPPALLSWLVVIVSLHLFSIYCIFYCLYFAAKAFKTAELQRETFFSDFSAEFFMIWFFPIGIWLLQPHINKVNQPDYQPPAFPHY